MEQGWIVTSSGSNLVFTFSIHLIFKTMKKINFEKITLRSKISSRGGGIEISLNSLGFRDMKMSAYQNYLGGGLLAVDAKVLLKEGVAKIHPVDIRKGHMMCIEISCGTSEFRRIWYLTEISGLTIYPCDDPNEVRGDNGSAGRGRTWRGNG